MATPFRRFAAHCAIVKRIILESEELIGSRVPQGLVGQVAEIRSWLAKTT